MGNIPLWMILALSVLLGAIGVILVVSYRKTHNRAAAVLGAVMIVAASLAAIYLLVLLFLVFYVIGI